MTPRPKAGKGEDIDFDGGLTLLTDRAFVEYKGTEYEVDPTTFGFLKSAFEQAQQQGGAEAATHRLPESGGRDSNSASSSKTSKTKAAPTSTAPRPPRSAATSTSAARSTR